MKLLQTSRARHIAKTITWRIIGTIDTMLVGWIITGSPLTGLKIGGFEILTKMTLYCFHERAWYKINLGLDRPKTISNDITWSPNENSMKQVAFLQHTEGNIRKRVKITSNGNNYVAVLSSYNKETKERLSDVITGNKELIEKQLNISI